MKCHICNSLIVYLSQRLPGRQHIFTAGKPLPFTLIKLSLVNRIKVLFTLIELLAVIAIISIMMSLLLPGLKAARDHAKLISCSNNLKQLSNVTLLYAQDYGEYVPKYWYLQGTNRIWYSELKDSGLVKSWGPATIFMCPKNPMYYPTDSNRITNYAMSDVTRPTATTWLRLTQIKKPVFCIMYFDSGVMQSTDPMVCNYHGTIDQVAPVHGKSRLNFVFFDGHVQLLMKSDLNINRNFTARGE